MSLFGASAAGRAQRKNRLLPAALPMREWKDGEDEQLIVVDVELARAIVAEQGRPDVLELFPRPITMVGAPGS